jgi:hypothetical protein
MQYNKSLGKGTPTTFGNLKVDDIFVWAGNEKASVERALQILTTGVKLSKTSWFCFDTMTLSESPDLSNDPVFPLKISKIDITFQPK